MAGEQRCECEKSNPDFNTDYCGRPNEKLTDKVFPISGSQRIVELANVLDKISSSNNNLKLCLRINIDMKFSELEYGR